jgi:hypothetical protein
MRVSSVQAVVCLLVGAAGVACGEGPNSDAEPGPATGGTNAGDGGSNGSPAGGSATTPSGGAGGSSGGTPSTSSGGSGGSGANAGSAGDGGSGGSVTLPPHIIEPCDGEGDLPRGVWDNITPADVSLETSGTLAFMFHPQDHRIIFLGTNKAGIFKTTDCGATWDKINTGELGAEIENGSNNHILVDHLNPDVLYVTSGYGGPSGILKSTNGGVDWFQTLSAEAISVMYGGFIESLEMDPADPAHLVTIPHGPCSGDYGPGGCFAESTDSGETWVLQEGTPGWNEGQNLEMISSNMWLVGEFFGNNGIWRTSNGGDSWQQASTNNGAAFHRGANGNVYAVAYNVQMSTDDGATWSDVANSPKGSVITGDGTNIYINWAEGYFMAPENDITNWTQLETPPGTQGACLPSFTYDQDHQILYSTNCSGGLWRATIP